MIKFMWFLQLPQVVILNLNVDEFSSGISAVIEQYYA